MSEPAKICQICGNPFSKQPGTSQKQWSSRSFCSRACTVASRRGVATSVRHGHTRNSKSSPTYVSWYSMVQRCTNPNNKAYAAYGAAGVRVCAAWLKFDAFLNDMGERPPGTTIDRHPNGSGNYEPGNCRWATPTEQSANTRRVKLVTLDGEAISLNRAAKKIGVDSSWFSKRVRRLGTEEAVARAKNSWRPGHRHPNAQLSEAQVRTIKQRLARGDRGADIARDFSVTPGAVSLIKRGKNWSWV